MLYDTHVETSSCIELGGYEIEVWVEARVDTVQGDADVQHVMLDEADGLYQGCRQPIDLRLIRDADWDRIHDHCVSAARGE